MCRHKGMQLVCFLEELSLKNIFPISFSCRHCLKSSNLFKTYLLLKTHISNPNPLSSRPPPQPHPHLHLLVHRSRNPTPSSSSVCILTL
ncbi:hypothetical protein HanHA89_Chr07g0264191 [Helianthus annuus]|nr:hypothetical protein HanHA89_Chr07g0264191 [Helianthus annuus]